MTSVLTGKRLLTGTDQWKSQTQAKNRRTANRYEIRMPLRYRPVGKVQNSAWKYGHTLNVSASGLLVKLPEATPVGSTLELAVDWPGLYFDRPMVHLLVVGYIARIEKRGTALRILSHRFREIGATAGGSRNRQENRAVA
jgi:hypothetical protein